MTRDAPGRHLCRGIVTNPLGLHCDLPTIQNPPGNPGSEGRFLAGLQRAVEWGATFVDTADSYGCGHSERLIGRFRREHPDSVLHLSSKVGKLRGSAEHPYAGQHIRHQLEQSLDNLYAEELHLYTLDSHDFGPGDRYLGSAIDTMRALREVESIKAIGMRGPCTPYEASPQERAIQAARFLYLFRLIKPDVIWTRFNDFTPAVSLEGDDLFTFTARHGVGLVLLAPRSYGLVAGKTMARTTPPEPTFLRNAGLTHPAMERASEGLQALHAAFGHAPGTLARLALRSALQRGDQCVVVIGFENAEQIDENYSYLGAPLTPAELGLINDVYASLRAHFHETASRSGLRMTVGQAEWGQP
ncbi:aldo/keto reductase [Streptomyces sp. NPDC056549]|uniref:aldo/keto reductase n=1 Tax=Streptomyces sp. NPDC056549 TaxID=3345864 RepID=UPI0036A1FF86